MASIGSTIFITGLVAIKWAARLNIFPSPTNNIRLTVRCTKRNIVRNRPVILMISFLPRDELNIPFIDFGFRVTENKLKYYDEGSRKFSEKMFYTAV